MKLARKLQLAYLSLILVPFITVGSLFVATYYTSPTSLGLYADLEAPGWIKAELATILEEDWEAYEKLRERVVLFMMDSEGYIVFPEIIDGAPHPVQYPTADTDFGDPEYEPVDTVPRPGKYPMYIADVFDRFGTDWTLDISMTPILSGGEKYLVGWRMPTMGIPGFLARKGWFMPLLFLAGVMLIPAFIDANLRRSMQRLQDAIGRLSDGDLDEPIAVLPRDNLADLAESLEKTRIELKEGRDRKARFLMAVSHDLRTPLTSIKGYIEALEDGMAENVDEALRYVGVLSDKAGLLEERVGELIDFARSQTGGWKKPRAVVDAAMLFAQLDASFRKDCGFAGREYSSEIAVPSGMEVEGDAHALYRAWENLFQNALRHAGEESRIELRARVETLQAEDGDSPAGTVLIGEVADTGPGVPHDFVPLLFEAFSRGDRGRNTGGLGLGLASVKAVAEAHDGSVDYRPAEGGGSVFCIRIPCRPAGDGTAAAGTGADEAADSGGGTG